MRYLDPAPLLERFPGMSAEQIAAKLDVTRRTVVRWRGGRGVDPRQADRLAVAVGVPPYSLWPELADQAVEQVIATCAAPNCDETFVVTRKGRMYCSHACANRASYYRTHEARLQEKRDRYANDPEHRAQKLAATAAYRATSRRAIRAQQADYRARMRAA